MSASFRPLLLQLSPLKEILVSAPSHSAGWQAPGWVLWPLSSQLSQLRPDVRFLRKVCCPYGQAVPSPTPVAFSRDFFSHRRPRGCPAWTSPSLSSAPLFQGRTPSSSACHRGGEVTPVASRTTSGFPSMGTVVPMCIGGRAVTLPVPQMEPSADTPVLPDGGQASLSSSPCCRPESISDSGICLINPFITSHSGKSDRLQSGNRKAPPHAGEGGPPVFCFPLPPPLLQMWPESSIPLGNWEAELFQCQ